MDRKMKRGLLRHSADLTPRKPDPDGQNEDRARWAQTALEAFQTETQTEDCDRLKDLLCDLMHWSDEHAGETGADFETALDSAKHHYEAETSAYGLTAEDRFPIEDWQYDAANGATRLGYADWVAHNIESEKGQVKP